MAERTTRSKIIGDSACPVCKRQGRDRHNNHLIHFDNGNKFCNRCGYKEVVTSDNAIKSLTSHDNEEDDRLDSLDDINTLESLTVRSRGISEAIMSKYGVKASVNTSNGEVEAVYFPITRGGKLTAYKVRSLSEKSFHSIGDAKKPDLFGQSLAGQGGKFIIITEGEFDCLAVSQMLANVGKSYKVVSLPTGANDSAIKQHMEWLEGFEKVVLWFDNDEAGNKARDACASLLSMGKVYTITTPDGLKDANDCLLAGKSIMQILASARQHLPDGIIEMSSIKEEVLKPVEYGYPWCFPQLTNKTFGRYDGNILTFGAGSGMGKTSVMLQQAAYDIEVLGFKVGLIFLETPPVEMAKRIAGKIAGVPFHLPNATYDVKLLDDTLAHLNDKVFIYENKLGSDWEVVKGKIRAMTKAYGVKMIYLDHLTAMADTSNERESLEQIMKEMALLATETGCIIHLVSHLTTPEGKPHEEGGRIMGKHFKGSRAIMFWSHFMFGLEGNVQAEDEEERNKRNLRVVKDRISGMSTGFVLRLTYDHTSGKLNEDINEEW